MRGGRGGASTTTPARGCWPTGYSTWSDVEPAGVGPGRAKRGAPRAGDHAAGDPPGAGEAARPGQPARLLVLPSLAGSRQVGLNGVALEASPIGLKILRGTTP